MLKSRAGHNYWPLGVQPTLRGDARASPITTLAATFTSMSINAAADDASVAAAKPAAESAAAASASDVDAAEELFKKGLACASSTPPDHAEAVDWWLLAAEKGSAEAAHNLGVVYLEGRPGVATDEVLSVKWVTAAAKRGEPKSLFYLGRRFAEGKGVRLARSRAHRRSSRPPAHHQPRRSTLPPLPSPPRAGAARPRQGAAALGRRNAAGRHGLHHRDGQPPLERRGRRQGPASSPQAVDEGGAGRGGRR